MNKELEALKKQMKLQMRGPGIEAAEGNADRCAQVASDHAKHQAIAFGIWLSGNLITEDDTIQDKWWNPAGDSYTTAEVYEKFIEHQNKTA